MLSAGILACLLSSVAAGSEPAATLKLLDAARADYREPVDAVFREQTLYVANSRTGSVSCLDPDCGTVISEWKIAGTMSGMARYRDGLFCLDDATHQLLQVQCTKDAAGQEQLSLVRAISIPHTPVDVAVSEDETTVAVSSLWARQVTLIDARQALTIRRTLDLPFAPRLLRFLPSGMLVVADSFGGRLAVIDPAASRVVREKVIYGHNIRGLCVNPTTQSLMVTCQTLDSGTFTSYERVFWGVVMQNGLHSIPLQELTAGPSDEDSTTTESGDPLAYVSTAVRQRYPLGTPSIGSGDPGAVELTSRDTTMVLISGVNQIAFRLASHLPFERLKTGRRPEALCMDDEQQKAFVINRFDDSVTVISLHGEAPAIEQTISLGGRRELSEIEVGQQLFFDASLSLDGWFSCHSCHTDGHTNGGRADTFGDEDRGAPKKVVSLLGVGASGPWAWNGSKSELEEQIRTSLIISMQCQLRTEDLPVSPLLAWLGSLPPAPGIRTARRDVPPSEQISAAQALFESHGCRECHGNDALTSSGTFDVGLYDEMGETRFNPPSLKGVSQRAPWFHDGRADSLADVLKSAHHNAAAPLSDEEIRQLTVLLETF